MKQEMTPKDAALIAAKAADEKQATDIVIQEVSDLLKVTDYFVICTAANARRAEAIVDEVEEQLRTQADLKPISREGLEDYEWALLDFGNLVVHVFLPEPRDYYRLEQLWEEAPTVDLALAGIKDPVFSERIASLLDRDVDGD
ncbi:MAG: ribosome silencing factor [Coriobacteriaceae bacterium]|nr:ribosome silencing factor [Coriobacteriaceae bacterium]